MQNQTLLSQEKILSHLSDDSLKRSTEIVIFQTIPSTNDYLKQTNTASGKNMICLAEQQTAGRGRSAGKKWHSPFGCNIYFSYRRAFQKNLVELSAINLVVGLAIIQLLASQGVDNLQIKWPNDVYYKGKKISGNLTDVAITTKASCQLIMGVGINVNLADESTSHIDQAWTSLALIGQQSFDRNYLIAQFMQLLESYLVQYESTAWQTFADTWSHYDYLFGKHIMLYEGEKITQGRANGVNSKGQLIIISDSGVESCHSTGSIRYR